MVVNNGILIQWGWCYCFPGTTITTPLSATHDIWIGFVSNRGATAASSAMGNACIARIDYTSFYVNSNSAQYPEVYWLTISA